MPPRSRILDRAVTAESPAAAAALVGPSGDVVSLDLSATAITLSLSGGAAPPPVAPPAPPPPDPPAAGASALHAALVRGILTLPDLTDPAQVRGPDFSAVAPLTLTARPVGYAFNQPATGLPTTKIAAAARFWYSNGPNVASYPIGPDQRYRAIVGVDGVGNRIVGFRATATDARVAEVVEPPFSIPGLNITEMAAGFAPNAASAHVLYALEYDYGGGRVRIWRVNTTTKQAEQGGPFAASFPGGITRWMPWSAQRSVGWMFVSTDERRISFQELKAAYNTATRCAVYDAGTDTLRLTDVSAFAAYQPDEQKMSPEGTRLLFSAGASSAVEDLATGARRSSLPADGQHTSWGDDGMLPTNLDGSTATGVVDSATMQVTKAVVSDSPTAGDPGGLLWWSPEYTVCSWRQPGLANAARFVGTVDYDLSRVFAPNGAYAEAGPWASVGGGVYRLDTVTYQDYSNRGSLFAYVWDFAARKIIGSIGPRPTLAALQAAPSGVVNDPPNRRIYVKLPDGGSPQGRLDVARLGAAWHALTVRSYDGSVRRLVGHTHNTRDFPRGGQEQYAVNPHMQFTPDGRWMLFHSNHGVCDAAQDTWAIKIPEA